MEKEINNEKFDIILIAGQSNAEGCGLGEDKFEFVLDNDIMIMRGFFEALMKKSECGNTYLDFKFSDEYKISNADYIFNNDNQKTGCFAFSFAKEYKANWLEKGRKILIVHTAIGGTGFASNHWGVDDCVYKRMIKMVNYALGLNSENRLVAFLWHQGERDCIENEYFSDVERQDFYYRNLTQMLTTFRDKFGNLPFISAGFTRKWRERYPSQCQAIYDGTQRVVNEQGNAAFITQTEDLKSNMEMLGNQDEVHFCKEALG